MNELVRKQCLPCVAGIKPMPASEIQDQLSDLMEGWKVVENHHMEKEYKFRNFKEAFEFTIDIGHLAEREAHHPLIQLSWGKVRLTLWTHKADGLTLNDFILAAKADACFLSRTERRAV